MRNFKHFGREIMRVLLPEVTNDLISVTHLAFQGKVQSFYMQDSQFMAEIKPRIADELKY